jgi:hypothetical protein
MDLRAEAWSLAARGVQSRDNALIVRSNSAQVAANEAATAFMKAVNPGAKPAASPAGAVAMDDGSGALQEEVARFQAIERRAIALYNEGVAQVRARKLSNAAFADRIQSQLLPEWNEEYERVSRLKASGAAETRRKLIADYMRLRGDGWRLTAEGLRTQSPKLLKEAAETEAKAEALLKPQPPARP